MHKSIRRILTGLVALFLVLNVQGLPGGMRDAVNAVAEESPVAVEAPAEKPAAPAEKPAAPAEKTAAPAENTAAPAENTAAPAENTAAPAENTAAPAETDTPAPTVTPATDESAVPTDTPAAGDSATPSQTPAADGETPMTSPTAEESATPVPEETAKASSHPNGMARRSNSYDNNHLSYLDIPGSGMEIPRIYQNSYRTRICTINGVDRSVSTSGCGAVAASMVIAYITGNTDQTPYTLFYRAAREGNYAGDGLGYAGLQEMLADYGVDSSLLGVSAQRITDMLNAGRPIIINMGRGTFTNNGHYLVLRGLTEDGRVLVNDPNSRDNSSRSFSLKLIVNEAKSEHMLVARIDTADKDAAPAADDEALPTDEATIAQDISLTDESEELSEPDAPEEPEEPEETNDEAPAIVAAAEAIREEEAQAANALLQQPIVVDVPLTAE